MKRIFMNLSDDLACGFYRAVLPVEHCKADLASEGIELVGSTHLDTRQTFDAYIFHRIPNKLDLIKSLKGRIIWEVDDALDIIPKWNPASKEIGQKERDNLQWALDLADTIIVTTEPLKKHFKRPEKTIALPNLIDIKLFQPKPKVSNRVLWAGSLHHKKDLDILVPLVSAFPELEFVFFGDCPAKIRSKVTVIPGVELKYYFSTIREIAAAIALCPLVDSRFNRCKSGLKFLEMAANGSAVLASKLPPYGMIDDCVTGLFADNWQSCLGLLAFAEDYREKVAELARDQVARCHSWQCPAKETWLNAFRSFVA